MEEGIRQVVLGLLSEREQSEREQCTSKADPGNLGNPETLANLRSLHKLLLNEPRAPGGWPQAATAKNTSDGERPKAEQLRILTPAKQTRSKLQISPASLLQIIYNHAINMSP